MVRAGWYEECVERTLLIWAAEGMGKRFIPSIRDVRHTLVAGDMMVSFKSTVHTVNQGGTADNSLFVLDRCYSVRDFFISIKP